MLRRSFPEPVTRVCRSDPCRSKPLMRDRAPAFCVAHEGRVSPCCGSMPPPGIRPLSALSPAYWTRTGVGLLLVELSPSCPATTQVARCTAVAVAGRDLGHPGEHSHPHRDQPFEGAAVAQLAGVIGPPAEHPPAFTKSAAMEVTDCQLRELRQRLHRHWHCAAGGGAVAQLAYHVPAPAGRPSAVAQQTAVVRSRPELDRARTPRPSTRTGVVRLVVEPSPNWPSLLKPQQNTRPVSRRTQLWSRPAATRITRSSPMVRGTVPVSAWARSPGARASTAASSSGRRRGRGTRVTMG